MRRFFRLGLVAVAAIAVAQLRHEQSADRAVRRLAADPSIPTSRRM
jgi:hypothetical protein